MAPQNYSLLVAAAAACVALVALSWPAVNGQDVAPPAAMPKNGGLFSFEPMVDTGVSEFGGRRVTVHVPGIFDLKLDTRPNHQGARLSQTVMSGLVSINLDRTRQPDGSSTGPIEVRMFGMPIYRNEAARSGGLASAL